jgi:hypothetical protein
MPSSISPSSSAPLSESAITPGSFAAIGTDDSGQVGARPAALASFPIASVTQEGDRRDGRRRDDDDSKIAEKLLHGADELPNSLAPRLGFIGLFLQGVNQRFT